MFNRSTMTKKNVFLADRAKENRTVQMSESDTNTAQCKLQMTVSDTNAIRMYNNVLLLF